MLTKVVGIEMPFTRTTDDAMKPEPVTVMVLSGSPTRAVPGVKEVRVNGATRICTVVVVAEV